MTVFSFNSTVLEQVDQKVFHKQKYDERQATTACGENIMKDETKLLTQHSQARLDGS